jgi:hypothetical protein
MQSKAKPTKRKNVLRRGLFSRTHTFEFIAPISMRRCLERLDWISRWGITLEESTIPTVDQHPLEDLSFEFRFSRKDTRGSRWIEIVGILSSLEGGQTLVSGNARSLSSVEQNLWFTVLLIVILGPLSIPVVALWFLYDRWLTGRDASSIISSLEAQFQ